MLCPKREAITVPGLTSKYSTQSLLETLQLQRKRIYRERLLYHLTISLNASAEKIYNPPHSVQEALSKRSGTVHDPRTNKNCFEKCDSTNVWAPDSRGSGLSSKKYSC